MIGYLIGNWNQFYIVDENNRSLAKTELTGSLQECAHKIERMREGVLPPEVITIVKKALEVIDVIAVEDEYCAAFLEEIVGPRVVIRPNHMFRRLRLMFFKKGIHKRHSFCVATAVQDKKKADAKPDMIIHRLIDMLNVYDETYQFYKNVQDTWYKDRLLKREQIHSALIKEESLIQEIDTVLKTLSVLQAKTRELLASTLDRYAPNVAAVAGPEIAARLLAEAGSLQQLSVMSAGTIQILGASRAFFRARHAGTNLPKFGIIFSHPFIQGVPVHHQGKMARSLSCQIAIASRADTYTHRNISTLLLTKLKKRFETLKVAP